MQSSIFDFCCIKVSDVDSDSHDESDLDDSGDYLHPLLLGGGACKVSGSQSPVVGPKAKEECSSSPIMKPQIRADYKLGKVSVSYEVLSCSS